jgi:hypothetical protein
LTILRYLTILISVSIRKVNVANYNIPHRLSIADEVMRFA